MPTPAVMDSAALTAPISGDDPAGRKFGILEINKFKDYRTDFDPQRDLSESDRKLPQYSEAVKVVPQWDKILSEGTRFLTDTGKDLQVVFAMTEAATKKHGFAGARDSLKLLRLLCQDCWDRLHPRIDDPDDPDDVAGRTDRFAFLNDDLKLPFYPNTVRAVPILANPAGPDVTYFACQPLGNEPPTVSFDKLQELIHRLDDAEFTQVRQADEDLVEAIQELDQLSNVLDAKAGQQSPALSGLRKAFEDCRAVTQQMLKLRGSPPEEPTEATPTDPDAPTPSVTRAVDARPQTREEVYKRLTELTVILERFDPHSPVPLLIRRAVEMRDLTFAELVDKLTRDHQVLDFLRNPLVTTEDE